MPNPRPKVFLDSNVIFSGLYSPAGAPGVILERFVTGQIRVVVSPQVLEEVIRVVKEKLPDALPALRRLLVNTPPEVTTDPTLPDIKRWTTRLNPGDAAILAAAITSRPAYFITGDSHFVGNPDIIKETGLAIILPAEFLKIMVWDEG